MLHYNLFYLFIYLFILENVQNFVLFGIREKKLLEAGSVHELMRFKTFLNVLNVKQENYRKVFELQYFFLNQGRNKKVIIFE